MLPTVRRTFANPFFELQREIDRVFDHAWEDSASRSGGGLAGTYPVDVHEQDDAIVVHADLPGFKREDIEVTLEQGVLTITAERKPEEVAGQAHLQERRYTRVTRAFRLGQAVDEQKVTATLEDGVLRLTIPKREELKPRKIEVK